MALSDQTLDMDRVRRFFGGDSKESGRKPKRKEKASQLVGNAKSSVHAQELYYGRIHLDGHGASGQEIAAAKGQLSSIARFRQLKPEHENPNRRKDQVITTFSGRVLGDVVAAILTAQRYLTEDTGTNVARWEAAKKGGWSAELVGDGINNDEYFKFSLKNEYKLNTAQGSSVNPNLPFSQPVLPNPETSWPSPHKRKIEGMNRAAGVSEIYKRQIVIEG